MAASPEPHIDADRFAEYIDELREFSGTQRIPFGKPEDLAQLLAALDKSPSFAMDFGSMIRSIVLREHFKASETELLTMVAIAWGGEQTDDSMDLLPALVGQLEKKMQEVLRSSAVGTVPVPAASSAQPEHIAPDVDETLRELEHISPDVQMYKQLLRFHENTDGRSSPNSNSITPAASSHVRETHESNPPDQSLPLRMAAKISAPEHAPVHPPQDRLTTLFATHTDEPIAARRFKPNPGEVVATALTGLVAALILNLGSLPVYRARVTVYVSSPPAATASATVGDAAARVLHASSKDASPLDAALTEKVADRLLAFPHTNPILRQDAVSRGLRDLNLGGRDAILYADLVTETAHQVNVRSLQSQNLYEITCDSWSAQFAATFCNQVLQTLEEPQTGATSSGSIRTVDSAVGLGSQIYPHWYRQSFIGLAVGALAGLLLGFWQTSRKEDPTG